MKNLRMKKMNQPTKKILRSLMIALVANTFLIAGVAHATSDQDASDMLTAGHFSDEDENGDAVSRFGASAAVKRSQQSQAKIMNPISENSFQHSASRGPASVSSENISRDPAGTPTAASGAPNATDMTIAPNPKAFTRAINKQKAYQEVAIIANDQGFFPSTLFVTQGIPVHLYITGASKRSQCFMMDSFGVRRQIRSEKIEEVSFTPDQGGSYTFNCPMNGAKGRVVVKDLDVGRMPASVSVSKSTPAPASADENELDENDASHFERAQ
jgi:hypothetical protein